MSHKFRFAWNWHSELKIGERRLIRASLERYAKHIYSETAEFSQTGRPRARNGENKSAEIQKTLIFRPYPRYKQTEDRPAQRTPLLAQEILIPWGLTLRALPPHSNEYTVPREFRSPAAIQDPMPDDPAQPQPSCRAEAAEVPPFWTGCDRAHDCFVPEPAGFESLGC